MKVHWFFVLLLLAGCSSGGRIVSKSSDWIYNETEFEVVLLDVYNEYPDRELTTESVGMYEAGMSILLQETFTGDRAKKVLEELRKSEDREYWDEPIDLYPTGDVVLRFNNDGKQIDVSMDSSTEYVMVHSDGEQLAGEIYKTESQALADALAPFCEYPFLSGELEMRLESDRKGAGYSFEIKVNNGKDETVLIPPLEQRNLFIEFRDANGNSVYTPAPIDYAIISQDDYVAVASGSYEIVWFDVSFKSTHGKPVEVRVFYNASYDGENTFKLYSGWVPVG